MEFNNPCTFTASKTFNSHAFTPVQNSPSTRVLQDILATSQVLPHISHFQVSACLLALIKIEFTKADSFSLAILAADSIHTKTFMSNVKVFPTFPMLSEQREPINNYIIILYRGTTASRNFFFSFLFFSFLSLYTIIFFFGAVIRGVLCFWELWICLFLYSHA